MSEIIANSFTELELIQSDSENNNLDTALANFYSAFRDMRTNGEEIEAQIAAYFLSILVPTCIRYKGYKGYMNFYRLGRIIIAF
jgi:hypothetical protein